MHVMLLTLQSMKTRGFESKRLEHFFFLSIIVYKFLNVFILASNNLFYSLIINPDNISRTYRANYQPNDDYQGNKNGPHGLMNV